MLLVLLLTYFTLSVEPDYCLNIQQQLEVTGDPVEMTDTQILLSERSIVINDTVYSITSTIVDTVRNQNELQKLFDCQYSFDYVDDYTRAYVEKLTLSSTEEHQRDFAIVHSLFAVFVVLDGTVWHASDCDLSQYEQEALIPEQVNTYDKYFEVKQLKDSNDYQLYPAEFELVSEQVLIHDAYSILEVDPPKFETVEEVWLIAEENKCPEIPVTYDTIIVQALKEQGYNMLEVVPAAFETVTEQVLDKFAWLEYEIVPAAIVPDSSIVVLEPSYTRLQSSWKPGCTDYSLDCIDYEFIENQRKDTVIYDGRYTCPPSHTLEDGMCVKTTHQSAQYSSRMYTKLVSDATVTSTPVPAIYETVTAIVISDSEEIPDSCISPIYQVRKLRRLSSPGGAIVKEVPPQYETRTYERAINNGAYEILPAANSVGFEYKTYWGVTNAKLSDREGLPLQLVDQAMKDSINTRLLSLGYTSDIAAENLYNYTRDLGLPLLHVDDNLLALLDIPVRTNYRAIVSDIEPRTYTKLLGQESPNQAFHQTLLMADCNTVQTLSGSILELAPNGRFQLSENGNPTMLMSNNFWGDLTFIENATKPGPHLVVDLKLVDCNSSFTTTHMLSVDPELPILDIYHDEAGRKVIEFDIPIETCDLPPANLKFIEGIGTNAGLDYNIVDGKVAGYLLCARDNEKLIYQAPGYEGDCISYTSTTSTYPATDDKALLLYPNPTQGLLRVPQGLQVTSVTSSVGSTVLWSAKDGLLDISECPRGVYGVILSDENGNVYSQRIILTK